MQVVESLRHVSCNRFRRRINIQRISCTYWNVLRLIKHLSPILYGSIYVIPPLENCFLWQLLSNLRLYVSETKMGLYRFIFLSFFSSSYYLISNNNMSHLFVLMAVCSLFTASFHLYTTISCNVLAMKCFHFANGVNVL